MPARTHSVLFLLLVLANLIYSIKTHAIEALVLAPNNDNAQTPAHMYYIKDPLHQYTLNAILSDQPTFRQIDQPTFNMGYDKASYWLTFSVDARQQDNPHWLLEINYPLLDAFSVNILTTQGEVLEQFLLGDHNPFSQRPFLHRNFVVPLDFSQHQEQDILIHIRTSSSLQIPIRLWPADQFVFSASTEQYALGIYYGMMGVMFFYNLFLWFSIREKSYLLYICHLASVTLIQLTLSGLGFQYLWPNSIVMQQLALPISAGMLGIFTGAFTREFLQTKRHAPLADKALQVSMWAGVFLCLICLINPELHYQAFGSLVLMLLLLTVLLAAITMVWQKQRAAYFFLFAWVLFILGSITTNLVILGYLPNNLFTLHASKIGSALEVLLLSFALADRIKTLEKQKNSAEQKIKFELQQRTNYLQQANQLKTDFLAAVSHEFRTPLNGVIGSLEIAQAHHHAHEPWLVDAQNSARSMLQMVDRILIYTELQSGRHVLNSRIIDTESFFHQLHSDHQSQCLQRGLFLSVNITPDVPKRLNIDAKCLQHACQAVLSNAIRFSHSGQIDVIVDLQRHQHQACLVIRIRDQGVGIERQALTLLQQTLRGQRTGLTSRTQQPTMGMGLLLVSAICHSMEGHVSIDSNNTPPTNGTEVTLHLPLAGIVLPVTANNAYSMATSNNDGRLADNMKKRSEQDSTPVITATSKATEQESVIKTLRALIVDDNPINQTVLRSMLARINIDADLANHGADAISLLEQTRSHTYDLIFMDCQMPIMDGFATTRHLRNSALPEAKRPIIAITANALSSDEQRCRDVGMNGYLTKPYTLSELQDTIQQCLLKAM